MSTPSVEGRSPSAHRILLVEDDADVRMLMEMLLEAEGYTVVVAENGQAALDRLRDQPVDAILLDLMMPVMDGREFRRAQVRDPAIADIPVIVLSAVSPNGLDRPEDIRSFRKPVNWDAMLHAVHDVCT